MARDDAWLTRETLVRRVRQPHDDVAWDEFVRFYRGYVYNIARRMGLGHHDAEEIVQTVMVKLWHKLPDFEYDSRRGRFRGWLCTVTGNEVKMLLRRHAGYRKATERQELERQAQLTETSFTHELAEREWQAYVVEQAWKRIAGDFCANAKAAFKMISRGVKAPDIARKLGIAASSVYVYKKRVQDRLRREIISINRKLD